MSTPDQQPGPRETNTGSTPTFGRVFSTTGKVILALFLIAAGVGVVIGILNVVANHSARVDSDSQSEKYENESADAKKTTMPASKWNKAVAAAIQQHCPALGMTKEEAEKALGKPTRGEMKDDTWVYEKTIQKECLKYEGDKCAEYNTQLETSFVRFSPGGHVRHSEHNEGGWLESNCFHEPFYSRYYENW